MDDNGTRQTLADVFGGETGRRKQIWVATCFAVSLKYYSKALLLLLVEANVSRRDGLQERSREWTKSKLIAVCEWKRTMGRGTVLFGPP